MTVHAIAAQAEFDGFPKSESESSENPVARYLSVSRQCGGLIPQNLLPAALNLSKQRVSQFINQRRFEVHEIAGTKYVTAPSFEAFLLEERRAGRPVKELTFSKLVKGLVNPQKDENE